MDQFDVVIRRGDPAAFHAVEPTSSARQAVFFQSSQRTLVLGSSQRLDAVDMASAHQHSIAVTKRRSGGGGVLLIPDEFVWLDLIIPATDVLWEADVSRSMDWVGELWKWAVDPWVSSSVVHRAAMQSPLGSSAVCWSTTASGELVGPHGKLVGVSQRRTKHIARLQSMCHLVWRPELYAAVLPTVALDDIARVAQPVPATAAQIVERLTERLADLSSSG